MNNTFPCLRAALESEYAARAVHAEYFVEHGHYMHWAEENRVESDNGLRQWSTPAKWAAYQAGTLNREKAVRLATARALRDVEKTHRRELEKLDRAAMAPELEFVTLDVTWTRSATWGYNPRVKAVTNEAEVFTGTASGCGYDKLSAAVADALNNSPAVLRALYIAAENALASGQRFNRLNTSTVTWRDVLGYGSGYSVVPYFEGGCGASCFERIFDACGYSFRCTADAPHYDAFVVTRKGAA